MGRIDPHPRFSPPQEPRLRLHPPYDTGKVRIGWCYFPVQRNLLDADMYRLQTALLGPRSSIRTTALERLAYRLRGPLSFLSLWRHS